MGTNVLLKVHQIGKDRACCLNVEQSEEPLCRHVAYMIEQLPAKVTVNDACLCLGRREGYDWVVLSCGVEFRVGRQLQADRSGAS
jgi:hypothetical protein